MKLGPAPVDRRTNAVRSIAIDAIVRAGEANQGVPLGVAAIATAATPGALR